MFLITSKLIDRLAEPYKEPDMFACYATSQAISSTTTRVLLLINRDTLKVLFLSTFSSRVVEVVDLAVSDLEQQRYRSGMLFSASWSFRAKGVNYRFSIIKKMLTLGSMQADFLKFVGEHVVRTEL